MHAKSDAGRVRDAFFPAIELTDTERESILDALADAKFDYLASIFGADTVLYWYAVWEHRDAGDGDSHDPHLTPGHVNVAAHKRR